MLDNGAYSKWKAGKETDWDKYYRWVEQYATAPTTWAVIPDVINGGAEEQDKLIKQWPLGNKGSPVWHLDEPLSRLERLVDKWPKVCIGSTSEYEVVMGKRWQTRMDDAFNRLCKYGPVPWLHMLRGMKCVGQRWPFASVDSTVIVLNHWRKGKEKSPRDMADYWDSIQCASTWEPKSVKLGFVDQDRVISGEW